MSEVIRVRGEGGAVFAMQLPLCPHIERRIESGDITVLEEKPGRPSRAKKAGGAPAPEGGSAG